MKVFLALCVSVLLLSARFLEAQQVTPQATASIDVDAGAVVRQIPSTLFGTNLEWAWNGYLLWDDSSNRLDPDLVKMGKDLGVSLIRYPGGMYADFYHWQDGVGPRDLRPVVPFRSGDSTFGRISLGTDEALDFAEEVHGELMIIVNAGTGTPSEAADWVRYVNARGLRVRYWEIGNEIYINDGSVAQSVIHIDPGTYATRFLQFAEAMRTADPRIKIGAVGGENRGAYNFVAYPDWNKIVLQIAGDQIDFLAVHNAYAPVNVSDTADVRQVYQALLAAPVLIADNLRLLTEQIATYAPSRASQIGIAVTEWGPLFQMTMSGRFAQHTRSLGSGIFAAETLKAFIESPNTQIANFHVFNDLSIMCWICSKGGAYPPVWAPTAEAMAFQLFRQHFGPLLVRTAVAGPSYDSPEVGTLPSVPGVPYIDAISSLSADGQTLYVIVINKHLDSSIHSTISIQGFSSSEGTAFTLSGSGIDANTGTAPLQIPGLEWAPPAEDPLNPQFLNGGPGQVTITSALVRGGNHFSFSIPPHSVTAFEFVGLSQDPSIHLAP